MIFKPKSIEVPGPWLVNRLTRGSHTTRLSCHWSVGILSFSAGKPVMLPMGKISCGTRTVAAAAQIAATMRPER